MDSSTMNRNINLLNQRENLQAEPVASPNKKKITLKAKNPSSFRVSGGVVAGGGLPLSRQITSTSVEHKSAPRKHLSKELIALLSQQASAAQSKMMSPQIISSGKAIGMIGAIKLPAAAPGGGTKTRRMVRISKKSVKYADEGAGAGNKFNPYENSGDAERVTVPQQWQQSLPTVIHHQEQQQQSSKQAAAVKRPLTPEAQRLKCLDCGNMKDFIFGLQREVKRLQDLANEFNLQIILAGGTPQDELQLDSQQPLKQDQGRKKGGNAATTAADTTDVKKIICPDCPRTQKRQQAAQLRLAQEQAAVTGPNGASLLIGPSRRMLPHNNLIDGTADEGGPNTGNAFCKPGQSTSATVQQNGGVRMLKEMRRQAFEQEQLDFVGKITLHQQQVKLPERDAEIIREHQPTTTGVPVLQRANTPQRIGSSNLAFRKKKISVMQQLPPLAKQQQQPMNFQPQPHHIAKEDSEETNQ